MSQIILPFPADFSGPERIVLGAGNRRVAEALGAAHDWPFRTAVLTGPPRSGKTLFARWFASEGLGEAVDDAFAMDEAELFHHWNRTQESGAALLIVGGQPPWNISLPDLASRMGAALQLEIGPPDDAMAAELILSMAQERGLPLGPDAAEYLAVRAARSQVELERLVQVIDQLSMERKVAPTLGIWRAALEAVHGPEEPRLL